MDDSGYKISIRDSKSGKLNPDIRGCAVNNGWPESPNMDDMDLHMPYPDYGSLNYGWFQT